MVGRSPSGISPPHGSKRKDSDLGTRSAIGQIYAGLSGPVILRVRGIGDFTFDCPLEARDEAVRLSEFVHTVRDGLERDGFSSELLSNAAIICGLQAGGFRIRGGQPWPVSAEVSRWRLE